MEDEGIISVQEIDNPYHALHQPGMVPEFIHNHGVTAMVSGGMGRRAIDFFDQYGIQVATGASGIVRTALENFLGGALNSAAPCRESVEHDH